MRCEVDVLGDVSGEDVRLGELLVRRRGSAEDGGAELVRVEVRGAEADLREVDDGDCDEVFGKQSATESSL